jgi:[ribosomal protein S18]-alanine N-acetyltransferase
MHIRSGINKDIPFAKEMLFEAFFWNPSVERPDYREFFKIPEINKLLADWGRLGDMLIIAENEHENIGSAWYRLWTAEDHSYGFIDSNTPELGMGVKSDYRSKGTGRRLLRELISKAMEDGFKALSLSVDPDNFARYLYESEKFKKVGESGTSWTYKLEF